MVPQSTQTNTDEQKRWWGMLTTRRPLTTCANAAIPSSTVFSAPCPVRDFYSVVGQAKPNNTPTPNTALNPVA